jgi:hypothetical protein
MNIDRLSPLLKRTTLLLSLMGGIFLLTACGGSSDNKSSASSSSSSSSSLRSSFSSASVPANGSGIWPSVKVDAQNPKVLTFQWSAVDGATFYKLYKHDVATGGVVQVGADLTTPQATDEIGAHVHDWVNNYYYVEACNADACSKSDLTFTATEMIKAIGYVKASNVDANDLFGWSIALSADGSTLAVGAPAEDSKATGANGDQTNNDSTNSGAVYIFTNENGVWKQQAYLKASNTEQPNLNSNRMLINDRFGYKVALSDDGNTLAVSALLEDSPSWGINCNQDNHEVTTSGAAKATSYDMGAVYVFSRANTEWSQDAYVKPRYSLQHLDVEGGLRFGETLSLSGDGKTLAVGTTSDQLAFAGILNFHDSSSTSSATACLEFYPSSGSSTSKASSSSTSSSSKASSTSSYRAGKASGAVYIFTNTADHGWQEESFLKASNAEAADAFGASVALSHDGNTLAVGALGEDSNATGVNGDQANNTCYYLAQTGTVIDPGCKEAYKYAYNGVISNGAVYVFNRGDRIWGQQAYLKPSSTYLNTMFGKSVSLSGDGNTLAIGAPGDASNATGVNGDTTQAIENYNTGAAYIFGRAETTWAQRAYLKPSTLTYVRNADGSIAGGGEFGGDVSLSQDGNTLAVGSFREASNAKGINGDEGDTSAARAGAVFVFTQDNSIWTQKSYVKASNTDKDDRFGLSVAISGDGKTLAVGAPRESGRGYTATSSDSGTSSSATSSVVPDQNDNSAAVSGAVYLY